MDLNVPSALTQKQHNKDSSKKEKIDLGLSKKARKNQESL